MKITTILPVSFEEDCIATVVWGIEVKKIDVVDLNHEGHNLEIVPVVDSVKLKGNNIDKVFTDVDVHADDVVSGQFIGPMIVDYIDGHVEITWR